MQKKDGDKVSLRQNSYFLPGLVVVKFSNWDASSLKLAGEDVSLPENFLNYVQDLLSTNITADEFQTAQIDLAKNSGSRNNIDSWLDAASFQVKLDAQPAATLPDAQKVLERWRKEAVVKTLLFKSA